jgi:hypothetical protein
MDDQTRKDVLGEHMSAQLDAIHELVRDVPAIKEKVNSMDERLIRVEDKLDLVADAIKDHMADKSAHR